MRSAAKLVLVSIVVTALAACAAPAPSDESTPPEYLTWASSGGVFQENQAIAFQEPFTEETDITFENVGYDPAQMQAMVEADSVVWDVVNAQADFIAQYCGVLFEKLDTSVVDPADFIEGASSECGAPLFSFANILSYDADAFPGEKPDSVEDFFDTERFPGKRICPDIDIAGLLELALVADGVDPEDLYPLDLDRAYAKLDTIKNDLILAPEYGPAGQLLVDGQGVMALLVTGRTVSVAAEGVNLVPIWDFTSATYGAVGIAKGSPNAFWAQKAIAAAAQRDNAITFAELAGVWPARPDVTASDVEFPSSLMDDFNAWADERGVVLFQSADYYAENRDEIAESWNAWKLG